MVQPLTGFDAARFDGPRPMRIDEVVASERLFRISFGMPELEDEAAALAAYGPPRNGVMYVIAHEGRLVSQIDTFHDLIRVYGGEIQAGSVGGVCTHPDYRGHRLAGRLMEYCTQELVDAGANLLLISGGRGLYTRLGNVPHGRFLSFAITPPQGDGMPGAEGLVVRRATPADAAACARLYAAEPVHFARVHADFVEALQDPPGNTYVYADRWMIERAGEAVAYLCLGSPWHEELGAGIRHTGEYAGSRVAVAAVLGTLFAAGGVRELTWRVAWQDGELIQLLQAKGYRAEVAPLDGHTYRILNFPRFMADLRPLLKALLPADLLRGLRFEQSGPLLGGLGDDRYAIVRGQDRLELDGAAMTRLVMGSGEDEDAPVRLPGALAEVVPTLFPLPSFLPGLNYH